MTEILRLDKMEVSPIDPAKQSSSASSPPPQLSMTRPLPYRDANNLVFSFIMDMLAVASGVGLAHLLLDIRFAAVLPGLSLPVMVVTGFIIWASMLAVASVYDLRRNYQFVDEARRVVHAMLLATMVIVTLFYMFDLAVPRRLVLQNFAFNVLFLLSWRLLCYATISVKWLHKTHRILVVGTTDLGAQIAQIVDAGHNQSAEVSGFITTDVMVNHARYAGKPVLGTVDDDIFKIIETHRINQVLIAPARTNLARANQTRMKTMMEHLRFAPVQVHALPSYLDLGLYRPTMNGLESLPLINLRQEPMTRLEHFAKRSLDIMLASIGLLAVLPMMVMVAILIKLDSPGPVLFVQERIGKNGHRFKIYKFRSMVKNADNMLHKVIMTDENGDTIHKTRNDFRVTRLGGLLRKTSIDELPQLFNVLRGDMSLVGPRPEIISLVDAYEPWQYERFAVPAGMTGWWQVTGRSEKPCHLCTDKDIYYIRNYSLWLDMKILLKTIPAAIRGKGAF